MANLGGADAAASYLSNCRLEYSNGIFFILKQNMIQILK